MSYSVLLSVTGHTGSKGGLEKPVLQAKFCVKPDKTDNSGYIVFFQKFFLTDPQFKSYVQRYSMSRSFLQIVL